MKKLALDLDSLVVESFDTSAPRLPRGTVRGNDVSDTTCFQIICDCPTGSGNTCEASCEDTCVESCEDCTRIFVCPTYTQLSCCNAPISYCAGCTPVC